MVMGRGVRDPAFGRVARSGPPENKVGPMRLAIGRHGGPGLLSPEGAGWPTVVDRRPAGRWWAIYLVAGTAMTLAFLVLHANILFNIVGLSSPIAILLGVRLNRPAQRLPWFLFAAGQGLFVAGDILSYNYQAIFGTDIPFPSLGDALYLAVYPCLVAGLLLVVRSRMPGRDMGSVMDPLIIAIAAGTISWVLLLAAMAMIR